MDLPALLPQSSDYHSGSGVPLPAGPLQTCPPLPTLIREDSAGARPPLGTLSPPAGPAVVPAPPGCYRSLSSTGCRLAGHGARQPGWGTRTCGVALRQGRWTWGRSGLSGAGPRPCVGWTRSCPSGACVYCPLVPPWWLVRALEKVMADSGVIRDAREGSESPRVPCGARWGGRQEASKGQVRDQGSERGTWSPRHCPFGGECGGFWGVL